ncbi:DUF1761 domain-containing protein [Bacillus sp. JJ1562]|uniref:DUF1761 domain-containing protein n=1 Tax=Bacillus sp. JJ1562 TaxID=3122960 RepID=UPI0030010116
MIDFGSLQYLPIIVGGIVYIVYGGVYYSVVLSKKNKKRDILENQSAGPLKYIYSIILAFISSLIVGVIIQSVGSDHLIEGVGVGFIIGLLISLVYLKNTLFGLMSRRSFLVAIGDHLIIFTLLGTIHGLFM